MTAFKETVRGAVSHIVVKTGLTSMARTLFPKRGALVLYGHRIADNDDGYLQGLRPEWFVQQLEYLTRQFEIIPLSELIKCYEDHTPVPHRSVVLTFDDGFRDNFDPGLDILTRFHVPATIFLVTGSISSGELPWSQRLGFLFQRTTVSDIHHSILGTNPIPLNNPFARRRAYLLAKEAMRVEARDERERTLRELSVILQVESPRDRMLTWDHAREMLSAGIEMGAHTYSHSLLAGITGSEARQEMERSRDDLRERLGIERPAFCFPGGSVSTELVGVVRELGFRCAFLPNRPYRVNTLCNADAYSLGRVGILNGPAVQLEAELDGPLRAVRMLYTRM